MKKNLILGIAGSIRSNYKQFIELDNYISQSDNVGELKKYLSDSPYKFSNSDIALSFAMLGAKKNNADYKLVSILSIFKHLNDNINYTEDDLEHIIRIKDIDSLELENQKLKDLYRIISSANGVILSSPVYFGDRSSIANKFLQLTNKNKLLKDKVFGMLAVGAKRNGGQETTCIYGLYEALSQEALAVGNGPVTAQYGGTVIAGDINTAYQDDWGVERCFEVGLKVSDFSHILNNSSVSQKRKKLNIKVVITMDTEQKKYKDLVQKYFKNYLDIENFSFIELINFDIYRCIACNICPSYKLRSKYTNDEYTCVIQSERDCMKKILGLIKDSDAIVFVGVNSTADIVYRYQAFTERTRFMRRDNFLLTNTPIISMLVNEVGAINNPLHNLKMLTSYIRHNTVFLKPIELILDKDKVVYKPDFNNYLNILHKISSGRINTPASQVSYKATGYTDTRLDKTTKERK